MKEKKTKEMEAILVLTTVPGRSEAEEISSTLVELRLAACVTFTSACRSTFWWQGEISQEEEFILFIKTKSSLYEALEKKIKEIHPYDVPEIIALTLSKGFSGYLTWLEKETAS